MDNGGDRQTDHLMGHHSSMIMSTLCCQGIILILNSFNFNIFLYKYILFQRIPLKIRKQPTTILMQTDNWGILLFSMGTKKTFFSIRNASVDWQYI
jgi:hypothetical protein